MMEDIREIFQKKHRGFYKLLTESFTAEIRNQLYNIINDFSNKQNKELKERIHDYAEFCVLCDRDGVQLIKFEDYLTKLNNQNK